MILVTDRTSLATRLKSMINCTCYLLWLNLPAGYQRTAVKAEYLAAPFSKLFIYHTCPLSRLSLLFVTGKVDFVAGHNLPYILTVYFEANFGDR